MSSGSKVVENMSSGTKIVNKIKISRSMYGSHYLMNVFCDDEDCGFMVFDGNENHNDFESLFPENDDAFDLWLLVNTIIYLMRPRSHCAKPKSITIEI